MATPNVPTPPPVPARGVHGPSQVLDSHFDWEELHWPGIPIPKYVLYELHAGTFTAQGALNAIVPRLDELKDLGITAIELMPVAQFPGESQLGL